MMVKSLKSHWHFNHYYLFSNPTWQLCSKRHNGKITPFTDYVRSYTPAFTVDFPMFPREFSILLTGIFQPATFDALPPSFGFPLCFARSSSVAMPLEPCRRREKLWFRHQTMQILPWKHGAFSNKPAAKPAEKYQDPWRFDLIWPL